MPNQLPLLLIVTQVVEHTPTWVWAILAALIALGGLQMRAHEVSRARLAMMPIGLGGFSLWGAASVFGMQAPVLAAWSVGVALALAANLALRWPLQVRYDAQRARFALQGSTLPLLLMLSVFAVRYAITVTLVFHPDWKTHAPFALAVSAAYGLLSGLYAARALRILRSAASALTFKAA
jgi:hypothetical protein